MKVKSLLNEDSVSAYNTFSALTPLHVGVLKKIAAGRLDPFADINTATQLAIDELVDLGLLNSAYDLTSSGAKAVQIASRVASNDLRDARKKGAVRRELGRKEAPEPVDVEVELDGDDDLEVEEPADDIDLGGTLRVEKKKKKAPRVVKALDREDFSSFDKDDANSMDDDGEYRWS